MGVFNTISKIALSPITAPSKLIDKAFDAEDDDIRPSDILTGGISTVARGINKITKAMDEEIFSDED